MINNVISVNDKPPNDGSQKRFGVTSASPWLLFLYAQRGVWVSDLFRHAQPRHLLTQTRSRETAIRHRKSDRWERVKELTRTRKLAA